MKKILIICLTLFSLSSYSQIDAKRQLFNLDSAVTALGFIKTGGSGGSTTSVDTLGPWYYTKYATLDNYQEFVGSKRFLGNLSVGSSGSLAPLYVRSGGSGFAGALSISADEFCLEGSGNVGLTILSTRNNYGNIFWGDQDAADVGAIMYNHANDAIRIRTAGTYQMYIDNAGKVGIGTGTVTPAYKLEVNGTIGASGVITATGGNSTNWNAAYAYSQTARYTEAQVDSIRDFTIDSVLVILANYTKTPTPLAVTTSRSLATADVDKVLVFTSTATITVPASFTDMEIGDVIPIEAHNGAVATITGAAGVDINYTTAGSATFTTAAGEVRFGIMRKVAADEYVISGQ